MAEPGVSIDGGDLMSEQDYQSEHYKTHTINGKTLDVYVYSNDTDTYYDVFDSEGHCINLGSPFYEPPTSVSIHDLMYPTKGGI